MRLFDVTKTPAYKALANYHLVANPNASNYEAMYFNLDKPALKDVTVRKAIAMAIDYNALIQTARRGQAVPLCTDHGKAYVPGYQPNITCPKYDPAAANALLDQAGYTKGADGIRARNVSIHGFERVEADLMLLCVRWYLRSSRQRTWLSEILSRTHKEV